MFLFVSAIGLDDTVLQNEALLETGKVGCGGYALIFNESIEISASGLYETGEKLPLMANDFRMQDLLPLAKSSAGGNLYFKSSLLKNMW